MTNLHQSTLALSVYNAIQRGGGMGREQLLTMLRKTWDERLDLSEVSDGITYLASRKLVTETDGIIAARVTHNGAAATVVRDPRNQTELLVSAKRQP